MAEQSRRTFLRQVSAGGAVAGAAALVPALLGRGDGTAPARPARPVPHAGPARSAPHRFAAPGVRYAVRVNMPAGTVRQLTATGHRLLMFKAVQSEQSNGGLPVLWSSARTYTTRTELAWTEQYYAFVTAAETPEGARLAGVDLTRVSPGQTLDVGEGARATVIGGVRPVRSPSRTPPRCRSRAVWRSPPRRGRAGAGLCAVPGRPGTERRLSGGAGGPGLRGRPAGAGIGGEVRSRARDPGRPGPDEPGRPVVRRRIRLVLGRRLRRGGPGRRLRRRARPPRAGRPARRRGGRRHAGQRHRGPGRTGAGLRAGRRAGVRRGRARSRPLAAAARTGTETGTTITCSLGPDSHVVLHGTYFVEYRRPGRSGGRPGSARSLVRCTSVPAARGGVYTFKKLQR